jgi:hypothetical protein
LLGLRTAILVSAGLRLLSGILFNFWDKDAPAVQDVVEAQFSPE